MQLDEIKASLNNVNDKNYTFLLKSLYSGTATTISFFNLIIRETLQGNFPYIVEYRMDSVYYNSRTGKSDGEGYCGKIIYYDIDGYYAIKLELHNGDLLNYDYRNPRPNDGNNGGGGEIIISGPCAGHMPWEGCSCAEQPQWIIWGPDKSVLSDGTLHISFPSQTKRCPGETTEHCASEIDCEYGWDDA